MVTGFILPIIGIAVGVAILRLRKRKIRGVGSLVAFSIALIVWACAYSILLFISIRNSHSDGRFWLALITLSGTITATTLLTFILDYTGHEEWLNKWGILLLCLEPLITQVLFWTNGWKGYYSNSYLLTKTGIFLNPSPWYWINASYSDGLVILALITLGQTFRNKPRQYIIRSITVVVTVFIPLVTKIASLAVFTFILNLEPPLASYVITGGLLFYSMYRFKLTDIVPIARDTVVESLSDGWMVLDLNNRIVDLNSAAETLLGVTRDQTFGQPAKNILENWSVLNQEPFARELETKGSVRLHGELHYLSVRILPLFRRSEQRIGKMVIWRDITERRKTDNARQLARDEMFVLLHSISDAAFRTFSQNEFLMECISKIVYSFRSQTGMIFLLEDVSSQAGAPKIYLAAHYGIAREDLERLSASPEVGKIVTQILEKQEPFYVPDASTDPRLPALMQQSGNKSLVLLPLIAGEQVLGAIGLVKKEEGSVFGGGEITRLGIVADELASFIRNDRQRQQSLALEERQSLVRDLHDSMAQKLYGVVALTEAAQASLETGVTVQAADLSRIGESARQALKEMRLFLFQMKPVDLERNGLVAALNERLAAVEGRANIKARVLAEEDINLSLEKENILYNIALEALNNIMKHANAKSVTVSLKRRKASVILEVLDDGCGFDSANAKKGGMGLKNMQERAAKVNGKVIIRSAPGNGTRVIAVISENKPPSEARDERKP